jgi:hypothetical protein
MAGGRPVVVVICTCVRILYDDKPPMATGQHRGGEWLDRIDWAIKSGSWRVHRAFADFPCREEWISTALAAELRALLPGVSVIREAPCPIVFTPTGADRPVHCGTGRADIVLCVPGLSVVIEVKRDTPKTGAAQARTAATATASAKL